MSEQRSAEAAAAAAAAVVELQANQTSLCRRDTATTAVTQPHQRQGEQIRGRG